MSAVLAIAVAVPSMSRATGQLPLTGTSIPALQQIDQLVANFMAKYNVPGGAVGYCWLTKSLTWWRCPMTWFTGGLPPTPWAVQR